MAYVNAGIVTKDGTKDTITIGDTTYMGPKYTPAKIGTSIENNSVTAGQDFELGTRLEVSYIGTQADYGNRTFIGDKLAANFIATTASGGAVYGKYVSLKLSDSTFTGNTAANGGAVYNTTAGLDGADGQFSLTGCTFTANRATSSGGAVYVLYDEQTISGSIFTGNTAEKQAGAIYLYGGTTSISGSTFSGNTAGMYGGAIRATKDNILTLTDSIFSGNTAVTGGAVYNQGTATIRDSVFATVSDAVYSPAGTLTFGGTITTAAQINSTNAINFETGTLLALDLAVYAAGNTTSFLANYDTAFANNANFSITVNVAENQAFGAYILADTASTFSKSITITCGGQEIGTVSLASPTVGNYTLSLSGTDLILTVADAPKFERTVVESGQTKTLSGGSYTNPTPYDGNGAVAEVKENGTLIVEAGAAFSNNTATDGGAVFNAGTATITGSTFTGNTASENGGAVFNANGGTMTITDGVFTDNTAENGGAVANFGTATITDGVFTDNTASESGGAVYSNGTMTITDGVFTDNTAEIGGAVYNGSDGTVSITGSTFTGNTAKFVGGAVFNANGSTMTITDGVFTDNTAEYSGGAVYNNGTMTIRDSVFATAGDTICNPGENLTLGGTITTAAQIFSDNAITFENDTKLVLDLSVYTEGNTMSLLGNYNVAYSTSEANFSITVNVAADQAFGAYILADNAANFAVDKTITIVCDGETIGDISLSGGAAEGYTLSRNEDNQVILTVTENKSGIYGTTAGGSPEYIGDQVKNQTIGSGKKFVALDAYADGRVSNTTVATDGVLTVRKGGTAGNTTVKGGTLSIGNGGIADVVTVKSGFAAIEGAAGVVTADGGVVLLGENATVSAISATDSATLAFTLGAKLDTLSLSVKNALPEEKKAYFNVVGLTGSVISATIDKKVAKQYVNEELRLLDGFDPASCCSVFVNGGSVSLSDEWTWSENLSYRTRIEDGVLKLSGDGISRFADNKLDITGKSVVNTDFDYDGITNLIVRSGSKFSAGQLYTAVGTTRITVQNYASLTLNELRKDPKGGSHIISAGNNAEVFIGGTSSASGILDGVYSFTVGNDSRVFVGDKILGQARVNSIKLGQNTVAEFSGIDMISSKNSFVVGSNSRVTNSGDVANISSLTLRGGAAVKVDSRTKRQMRTVMTIDGVYQPAASTSTSVSIGSFADLAIGGGMIGGERYAVYNNLPSTLSATRISVGSNSTFTANGIVSGVSSLTLSSGNAYRERSTDSAKVQGKTIVNVLEGDTYYAIKGTLYNNTVKLGAFAELTCGDIDLNGGANTVSVAAKSKADIRGCIDNVATISLGNGGSWYQDLDPEAQLPYALARAEMTVSGPVMLSGRTTNTLTVGNYGKFSIGNGNGVYAGSGSVKLTVGSNASLDAGYLRDLSSLSVSSSVNYRDKNTSELVDGRKLQKFAVSYIEATDKNNTFNFGQKVSANINGYVDFKGGNDTLSIGKDSVWQSGAIAMGDGNDKLAISGGTFTAASLDFGTGTDTLILGASSKVVIDGDITGVTTLSSSSGKKDADTSLQAQNLHAEGKSAKMTFGNYSKVNVGDVTMAGGNDTLSFGGGTFNAGAIDFGLGNDKLTISGGTFTAASLAFGDGTDTLTIGALAEVTINGDITGVTTLTSASGKSGDGNKTVLRAGNVKFDTSAKSAKMTFGNYSNVNVGNVTMKKGNDALSVGKYSVWQSGAIDMGEGNDTLSFGGGTFSAGEIKLGAGNDKVTLSGGIFFADVLDLGKGNDTLSFGNDMTARIDDLDFGGGKDSLSIGKNAEVWLGADKIDDDFKMTVGKGATLHLVEGELYDFVQEKFAKEIASKSIEVDTDWNNAPEKNQFFAVIK